MATAYTITVPFRAVCTVPGAIPLMFPVASILFRTWLNPLDATGLCWTAGADAGLGDVALGALEAAGEVAEAATDSGVIEQYGDMKREQQAAKEAQKKAEQEAQQTAALERERQQERQEAEWERQQAEQEAEEKRREAEREERERKVAIANSVQNANHCLKVKTKVFWATDGERGGETPALFTI